MGVWVLTAERFLYHVVFAWELPHRGLYPKSLPSRCQHTPSAPSPPLEFQNCVLHTQCARPGTGLPFSLPATSKAPPKPFSSRLPRGSLGSCPESSGEQRALSSLRPPCASHIYHTQRSISGRCPAKSTSSAPGLPLDLQYPARCLAHSRDSIRVGRMNEQISE